MATGLIKQLKQFITGTPVFPVTKTNAVYDDTVGRLDTFMQDVLVGADVLEGETEDTPRDADTLGGYTPEHYAKQYDLELINDSLEEQPQFIYDENGKITGYTTKIGGADSVFPFKSLNTFNEIHRWISSDNGWTRSYTFTEDYKCILIVAGGAIGNMVCDNGDLILNELFSDKLRVVVYHNVPKDTVCTFTSVNGTHCYAIYDVS